MKTTGLAVTGLAGVGCLVIALPFLVVILLVAILNLGGEDGLIPTCAPGGSARQVQATGAETPDPGPIPSNYLTLYRKAGKEWNVAWNVLAGIGWIESKHGTYDAEGVHSGENFAGAGGPMQFLQPTFDWAKVDGDDDGVTSRYDPADAIFSAARLLKLHILPGGNKDDERKALDLTDDQLRESLFRYNHSWAYVDDVLVAANHYLDNLAEASDNYGRGGCAPLGSTGSFGQRIADAAAYYAKEVEGTPQPPSRNGTEIFYSWGGGRLEGPGYGICCSPEAKQDGREIWGFDCSGLARHAVYKASNEKITLPRTTWGMWGSAKVVEVSREQLAPGDLVFFSDRAHMGVYYGEFNGKRWMVEALQPGAPVIFSDFDARKGFSGARRVKPPPGMESTSPDPVRTPSPSGDVGDEGPM
ncbi:C40 family peptidase [Actinomadura sp. 3N407]|uniref:C40 family peptidase n=1 Tax=Actinomadura sp. 3N407 TaxID=3457423 RepID=UPI003FCC28E9